MKFVLEVDMGETALGGNAAAERGRILRYWGGNLQHYPLTPGDGSTHLRLELPAGRALADHRHPRRAGGRRVAKP